MTPEEFQALKKRVEDANRLTAAMAKAMLAEDSDDDQDEA